jgi:molecular chaperone GrpE
MVFFVSQEDSETEVIGNSVGDNGRVGTEEASPVLFTALRSFKEALIDDDNAKFAYYMDSFLLDGEINSLLNKISTLDARLAAARDRVLKIGACSDIKKERLERESWWRMCKGMLRKGCPNCFAS